MAANSFDGYYRELMELEGKRYEDVPGDAGGPTCCGVTIADVARWENVRLPKRGAPGWDELVAKVRALTPETAAPIYRKFYWQTVRGDDLPPGIDVCTVDYAINSGPGRAIPTLGRIVGVGPSKTVDDAMLAAVNTYGHLGELIDHYQDERRAFLDTISQRPSQRKFRRGWMDREARIRRMAHDLSLAAPVQVAEPATPPKAIETADAGFDGTLTRINDLAEHGSRISQMIQKIRRTLWGAGAATGVASAMVDPNKGVGNAALNYIHAHPFACLLGVAVVAGAGVYAATWLVEHYLVTAARDGRYRPRGL